MLVLGSWSILTDLPGIGSLWLPSPSRHNFSSSILATKISLFLFFFIFCFYASVTSFRRILGISKFNFAGLNSITISNFFNWTNMEILNRNRNCSGSQFSLFWWNGCCPRKMIREKTRRHWSHTYTCNSIDVERSTNILSQTELEQRTMEDGSSGGCRWILGQRLQARIEDQCFIAIATG